MEKSLSVSIVLYNSDSAEVRRIVEDCKAASCVGRVVLVDNSPEPTKWDWVDGDVVRYVFSGANLGYGTGHNIALRELIERFPYVLVLNSDVEIESGTLERLVEFMEERTEIGLAAPKVLNPDGSLQRLVKLLPTPIDLVARRFLIYGGLLPLLKKLAPGVLKTWVASLQKTLSDRHAHHYELGFSGHNIEMDVRYVSGCFMFMRSAALKDVGLFDERYFMYAEDIDLSRRIARKYSVIFTPSAQIIHGFGRGSYTGAILMLRHIQSMVKYFNKWGWIWDHERREQNKIVTAQIEKSLATLKE